LRRHQTRHETQLWTLLRARRFAGFKFRRQVPIGSYVADLVCQSARLVVELDGSQHHLSEHDLRRDAWLWSAGYRVLRFWNADLDDNRDGVTDAIWHALQEQAE
jgi:very-short-patch-repair endonuclease